MELTTIDKDHTNLTNMTVDERWYKEGPPIIEELAQRLWAYENVPHKLPWDELGVQGRVGPRRKAYEIMEIVTQIDKHDCSYPLASFFLRDYKPAEKNQGTWEFTREEQDLLNLHEGDRLGPGIVGPPIDDETS